MWMQAIREAISLGQALLTAGEAGCEAVSIVKIRLAAENTPPSPEFLSLSFVAQRSSVLPLQASK